ALILFFNQATTILFGRQPLFVAAPYFLSGAVELLPGFTYPIFRLAIIVVGLLVAIGLYILINKTRIGMLVRAGANQRQMVRALGVDIRLLFTVVFGLGALLAGLAGVMAGPILAVQVGMGEQILILTFVVVVIGGVGSVRGALFGALIWVLADFGLLDIARGSAVTWVGLIAIATILAIGFTWSKTRARLTGQVDVDSDE
ncbi:MAG: DUF6524 family protein, partial [Proteobacteria bacterium]|nr:DUF6524 family protein [Pseudomonadota bacterium]